MLDSTRMVNSFKTKMEAAFGEIDPTNFPKFAKALMDTLVEEFQNHAELNNAHLNSTSVTITGGGTSGTTGNVDDPSVVGGVK